MALSISTTTTTLPPLHKLLLPHSFTIQNPNPHHHRFPPPTICFATKSKTGPVNKQSSSPPKRKTTKKKKSEPSNDGLSDFSLKEVEVLKDDDFDGDDGEGSSKGGLVAKVSTHPTTPLPKPPAGFVVDETGKVLLASSKRLTTILDPTNNYPLECVIRRVFRSSRGDECMLLCPVDTPVYILKSTNADGWAAVNDNEVESILPAVAYALAKIQMHLVHSGLCYTARGGFCYTEDDIFSIRTDDGEDLDGLASEGVEITCFHSDGAHYMIYTPSDPLLFVAIKNENGVLQIADDDLLDDPAVVGAIDEETEFNALVEEEAALLESLID